MALPVFPFIVGCERSGTTLLRLMLDAHPQLAIPPESYFIVDLARRRRRYEGDSGAFDAEGFALDLAANRWFTSWQLTQDSLAEALEGVTDFAQAIRRTFEAYAREQGKARYADKTPAYVRHIRVLADVLPDARFVHLIRDGRDVAMSLAEVSWGPGDPLEAALQWDERVRRGRIAGWELGAHRYLEVRYEDLVARPEPTLREVTAFVELPFDPALLRHEEWAESRERVHLCGLHRRAATPPRRGTRDWRSQMAGEDLEAVETLVGPLLEELGYERAVPRPTSDAVRRARRAVARRRRRHLVRRLKFNARDR